MKKLILSTVLMFTAYNAYALDTPQPKEQTPYVSSTRFQVVRMTGFIDFIITDVKTGCQYLVIGGNGYEVEPLGCFEEYKNNG